MSKSQNGSDGGMTVRLLASTVTRYCNIRKKTAGEPKIKSSATRSFVMGTSDLHHKTRRSSSARGRQGHDTPRARDQAARQ